MAEPPRTRRTEPHGEARARSRAAAHAPGDGQSPEADSAREAEAAADFDWEGVRRAAERLGGPGAEEARAAPDLSALIGLLGSVRAILPPELDQQFTALVREVLLTLRALIDWYLERLDGGRPERRVEDIPIE